MRRYESLIMALIVIAVPSWRCVVEGFVSVMPSSLSQNNYYVYTRRFMLQRPREYPESVVTTRNWDGGSNKSDEDEGLVAACGFSETHPPEQERLTINGERTLYRNGRVEQGRWVSCRERPVPHLLDDHDHTKRNEAGDVVIDKNGFAWRAQHVLQEKGLTRNNMEATQRLYDDSNIPIPWNGPLNLPPQDRGTGSNRKLRDDLQLFGCELDDERWLVHYTKLATFCATYGHVDVPLCHDENESLGRWVAKQRTLYRRYVDNNYHQYEILADGTTLGRKINPLSPWRIQMLYDIGFSFKVKLKWKDRYAQLQQFKEQHGHVHVVSGQREENYPGLATWIQSQRTECRKWKYDIPSSSMTKRRYVMLDRLGLDWDPLISMWDTRVEQLKAFHERHGHVCVTKTHDYELATWLTYVRSLYRIYQETPWDSALTRDRIDELQELGIDWDPTVSRWQRQLDALGAFHANNGHCNVPVDYPENASLSLWVQKQRHDYRFCTLREEHEAQLRSLGFVFDLYEAAFALGLEKLQVYKQTHGDCRVSRSNSDHELVAFVKSQRTQYRKWKMSGESSSSSSSLTETRRNKLEALGFEWQVQSNAWQANYDKLLDFQRKHGHCNVPSDYSDQSLYRFVSVQRTQYRLLQGNTSRRLTPERISKLESIGFCWNTRDFQWMERYSELVLFQQTNGHLHVPDKYPTLGSWVRNQRVQYKNLQANKKTTMTRSRMALLEKVGFPWTVRKTVTITRQ